MKVNMNIKKTAYRFGRVFLYGGVSALVTYFSGLPQAPYTVLFTAILAALENFLKHAKDKPEVK